MAKNRTIILHPVKNPYAGHSADAPQEKDELHIPNVPEIRGDALARKLGVGKAKGKESPNSGTHFQK